MSKVTPLHVKLWRALPKEVGGNLDLGRLTSAEIKKLKIEIPSSEYLALIIKAEE